MMGKSRIGLVFVCTMMALGGYAETYTAVCTEDSYVQKNKPTENNGGNTSLAMRSSSSTFSRVPYLKFVVSGIQGNVTRVKLKLFSDTTSAPVKAYAINDNSWAEMGITWDNCPAFGSEIGSGTALAGSWFEIDITGFVTADGTYSLALDEQDDVVSQLSSREGGNAAYLEITTDYVNQPPIFNTDPIVDSAQLQMDYKGSIDGTATDPDGDAISYSKVSGPNWLGVRVNGDIVGTPDALGVNSFTVQAKDSFGNTDTATLNITVASVSPTFLVVNRAGSDVTTQTNTAINSDHIHIHALASVSLVQGSFTYKYLEQSTAPTSGEWAAEPVQDFWRDLWFYRKPVNQWVQVTVTDINNTTISAVYGLQGGTLTAPPDDPIGNLAYVDAMGPGLIVEADSDKEVWPELDVIEIKKAGFNHVRMHIGRLLSDKLTPNTPANNPDYYQNLDRWIEQIARHGMYCHIGNKGNSVWELSNTDDGSQAWKDGYAAEHFDWWTNVLDHCKFDSHRLAYHMFLETGGNSFMGSAPDLDAFHNSVTKQVRLVDPDRMLIYPPPSLNNVFRLVEMTFPYPDHDGGDGIDTGSGNYWFADFHKNFAGGRGWVTAEDRQKVEDNLQAAIDWVADKNVPLIMSAVRPTDSNSRHDEYIAHRIRFIEHLYDLCDSATLPIRITWLSHDNYNFEGGLGWRPGMRTVLEAMNRQGTADGNDPDGDQISTADEINIYGTNPYLADTDQDNILDTFECTMAVFDPLDPADGDPMGDESIRADFDGDGMDNAWEMLNAVKWGDDTLMPSHRFDPTDPADALEDAEGDGLPNIWERAMRMNPLSSASRGGDDATDDWDGDTVNNLDETLAQTWPMDDANVEFDADYDEIRSDVDPMPFIHDEGHVVYYAFDSAATDGSSQGSVNDGTLMNGALVSGGIVELDGVNDFIDIPTTDLGVASNRSVNLHFWAKQLGGIQVLYKEGSTSSGLSIYLNDNRLWMGVWNQPQEKFVELGSVKAEQWHAVTLAFDAGNLSGYLAKNNLRLAATNLSTGVSMVGDAAFRAALGGSDDATRIAGVTVSDAYFAGYFDDTQIYIRRLSENDAALLSRNDLYPAKQPALAGTLPYFHEDPIVEAFAVVDEAYAGTLAGQATDPNGDPLTFSKVSGPAWLSVAANGALSGMPLSSDVGANSFVVQVTDGVSGSDTSSLELSVKELAAPVTFTAIEDTFVEANNPTDVNGSASSLTLKNSAQNFARVPYLKFTVSGLSNTVGVAKLHVYSETLNVAVKAYATASAWDEMTMNWNTRPAFGAQIGLQSQPVAGAWFEVDITDYIASNGTFSIALDEQTAAVFKVTSREGSNPPYLEIRQNFGADTPESLYSDWIDFYPTLGTATNFVDNPDGDVLNNLGEYALGGNPTNPADIGYVPEFQLLEAGGSNWIEYVYAQRNDAAARGLAYSLELATNLVSNAWTNANEVVVGTAPLDAEFDAVTNRVPADGNQNFIRLRIEYQ